MRVLGLDLWLIVGATLLVAGVHARAQTDGLRAVSEIKGIAFTKLGALPKAPASARSGSDCEGVVIKPTSAAGKVVADRGWYVTGEARLGPYQTVGFAGHLEPGTSGTCDVSQGNVGIFEGTRLIAIAYAPRGSKRSIGKVKSLEGGNVRVWSGDDLPAPIGDIRLTDDQLRLGPIAARESLCGGRAIVPNIYDLPIDKARKALASNGWIPVKRKPQPAEEIQSQEKDLMRRGIAETTNCGGTGLDFCKFDYKGAGGALAVFTAGEWDADRGEFPRVADYQATCR